MKRKLLNTPQASEYLKSNGVNLTSGTLEVLRCQGRGPRYRKIGRKVYYSPDDLDAYTEGQVVETIDSREAA